jgi:nucleotide-binding universal stress UspA family protein
MFKRILVAVAGSHTVDPALQEAIKPAEELRARLRVVHVVDAVKATFRKSSRKILEKADAGMRKAGMTTETKMLGIETFGHRRGLAPIN